MYVKVGLCNFLPQYFFYDCPVSVSCDIVPRLVLVPCIKVSSYYLVLFLFVISSKFLVITLLLGGK